MKREEVEQLATIEVNDGIPIPEKVKHLYPPHAHPGNSKLLARSTARKLSSKLADILEEAYLDFMDKEADAHPTEETKWLACGERLQKIISQWVADKVVQEAVVVCGAQNNGELSAAYGIVCVDVTWKTRYEGTLTRFSVGVVRDEEHLKKLEAASNKVAEATQEHETQDPASGEVRPDQEGDAGP